MLNHEQVQACQEAPLRVDYINSHLDAMRRLVAGQRQAFCLDCQRWQWKVLACAGARLVDKQPDAQPESPK